MTATVHNVAHDASVGVQADVIHGDVAVYQVAPDAPPEEQFRTGVNYLHARMPAEARTLIEEAAARGHLTDEVQLYRLLALLSGRTLRQLGSDDLNHLFAICGSVGPLTGGDQWTAALRSVLRLLDSLATAHALLPGDTDRIMGELDSLPPQQHNLIVDHLGVLVEGPMEDQLWHRSVHRARAQVMAGARTERVWMFFEPVPVPPRVRPVRPVDVAASRWLAAGIGATVWLTATVNLGRLLCERPERGPILAYLIMLAGLAAFTVRGARWHFDRTRLRAKEAELAPPRQHRPDTAADGFANRVTQLFDTYFGRYVPRDTDRTYWLAQTAGIRRHLRDEMVDIYRESRVPADRLAWLVRHLVGDVRQRWERGTLDAHRAAWRTPLWVRACCALGLAIAVLAGLRVAGAAVANAPLAGTLWVLLDAAAGIVAVRYGFRINSECRRVQAEETERDGQYAVRLAAYHRWVAKLVRKPSDEEIASWLECDRRILVDDMMRHYRLRASQVIAHAFIEAPAPYCRRARVPRGPWRYSRYRLLLFLLTDDGVRQVDLELDLQEASSRGSQRLNYRFDAVAAVRVDGIASPRQTFELMLVNGEPLRVPVTESTTDELQSDEDPRILPRVALDASGLPHTLNVLEGIAAEGKEWIRHQRVRADERLKHLMAAVRDLID